MGRALVMKARGHRLDRAVQLFFLLSALSASICLASIHVHVHVIPPVVELAETGSCSALGIQLHCRHSQPHKACEHALLHVGILLEGHVLHYWW